MNFESFKNNCSLAIGVLFLLLTLFSSSCKSDKEDEPMLCGDGIYYYNMLARADNKPLIYESPDACFTNIPASGGSYEFNLNSDAYMLSTNHKEKPQSLSTYNFCISLIATAKYDGNTLNTFNKLIQYLAEGPENPDFAHWDIGDHYSNTNFFECPVATFDSRDMISKCKISFTPNDSPQSKMILIYFKPKYYYEEPFYLGVIQEGNN